MKRLSWKYMAGLVDGEGCLDVQVTHHKDYPGRPYMSPRVRIALVEHSKFVLDMLQANHGGSVWDAKRANKNPVWQNAFYWQLQGKQARPYLQNIVNHLEIKKEQAKLLIWMIDNVMGKHVSDKLREHLNDEMKAMKRDPQRLSEKAVLIAQELYAENVESKDCSVCGKPMRPHAKQDSHIACRADAIV